MEGKSNIAGQRLIFFPGFLSQGFKSEVVSKVKDKRSYYKAQGLRRSQRIWNKQKERSAECPVQDLPIDETEIGTTGKPNSKSLFKEINDRYYQINISKQCNERKQEQHKFIPIQNCNNQYAEKREDLSESPDINNLYRLEDIHQPNVLFCHKLRHISLIKSNHTETNVCIERIRKSIKKVNAIMAGKRNLSNLFGEGSKSYQNGGDTVESAQVISPIKRQNWLYYTPKKQRIGIPKIAESNIVTGILYNDNNNQKKVYKLESSGSEPCKYSESSYFCSNQRNNQHCSNVFVEDGLVNVGFDTTRGDNVFSPIIRRPEKKRNFFKVSPTPDIVYQKSECFDSDRSLSEDFTFVQEETNDLRLSRSSKRKNPFTVKKTAGNVFTFVKKPKNIFNFSNTQK